MGGLMLLFEEMGEIKGKREAVTGREKVQICKFSGEKASRCRAELAPQMEGCRVLDLIGKHGGNLAVTLPLAQSPIYNKIAR